MLRHVLTVLFLCFGVLAGTGRAQDKPASIEGKWETNGKDADGKLVRIVKEHKGGQTTRTVYDDKGEIVLQHKSQYELRKTDKVQVFTYFNLEVTAGPGKGQRFAGPGAYLYRIEGDSFYEVQGALLEDKGSPRIVVWKRVQEK